MENVDGTYPGAGQDNLSSPSPAPGIVRYQRSNPNLSWIYNQDFHLDVLGDPPVLDDLAVQPSLVLTTQLIEHEGDTYSVVESSDSCASWLSFLHPELDESNHMSLKQSSGTATATKASRRNPRNRLPPDAVKTLRSWFREHSDDPYPSNIEKEGLARQTGLSVSQISNWFNNARRPKDKSHTNQRGGHWRDSSLSAPLERWKNSPPETEPAATEDIIRALKEQPHASSHAIARPSAPGTCSSNSSGVPYIPMAQSVSSFEHSQSSGSELNFKKRNHPYQRPPTPIPGKRSRRRRIARPLKKEKDKTRRAYQCTFCADSFITKYDWQRHEKALHLSIDRWVCSPQGGMETVDNIDVCAFCHAQEINPEHFASHNFLTCHTKPIEERTFFRKDHLKQHLKLTHNVGWLPSMTQWRRTRSDITSRCGFCDSTFTTWDERVEHVAEHFKSGADMTKWKGDWGFDPEIMDQVQNAMPPYLLGYERNTMDPWRMTEVEGNSRVNESPLDEDIPNALSKYSDLQRDLVDFIRDQLAANIYPSDLEIQDTARLLAYGNIDRLDQTYADDPAWLEMIKREAGLELEQQDDLQLFELSNP
ncbi:hypothetical protein BJY04DRAFT_31110 [Aspergillus karnatakaensis]|uniref:homeobox domain-containing protein n=1 Tax=Aspergillus karnatakaensis TaxID=1810916 RepID=UPI003CCCF143